MACGGGYERGSDMRSSPTRGGLFIFGKAGNRRGDEDIVLS